MASTLMTTSIAAEWESYRAAVMPPDAPPVQIQETRRAFYAGFWAMLCVATNIGDVRPEPTDEAVAMMLGRLLDEGRGFQERVLSGRA